MLSEKLMLTQLFILVIFPTLNGTSEYQAELPRANLLTIETVSPP